MSHDRLSSNLDESEPIRVVPSLPKRQPGTGHLLPTVPVGQGDSDPRTQTNCQFWEDRPRPEFEARSLKALLTQVMEKKAPVKAKVKRRVPEELIRVEVIWGSVVGPLSESTRVVRFRQGILEVLVDSPVLQQDLVFTKAELAADLEAAGLEGIHEVRFKVGRV